jgi:DNA-directed RNA polymerase subunit N (RpoN/RPB10)
MGNVQLTYEKILDQICKDEDLKIITTEQAKELKSDLVKSFDFKTRYCCRPRLMTYKRVIDIVK